MGLHLPHQCGGVAGFTVPASMLLLKKEMHVKVDRPPCRQTPTHMHTDTDTDTDTDTGTGTGTDANADADTVTDSNTHTDRGTQTKSYTLLTWS